MKRFILRLLISLPIGFVLAFGFGYLFLDLPNRLFIDQVLLVSFATAAFCYLTFSFIESRVEILNSLSVKRPAFSLKGFPAILREHAAGLLLGLLFFGIYTYIGLKLNRPTVDTVDNFLDADNTSWMLRIAGPAGGGFEMRGPHPFTYFILRPLGWMFNLFTQSPPLSAILINTLTGGLCVFLTWILIKNLTGNKNYALLIACLLGLSTAHIFFGSVVESYIFSAAALIGFMLLLQSKKDSMALLVAGGLLTFGITLTNFMQNLIGIVVVRPKLRNTIRFAGLTISLGIILSILHAVVYPSSKLFFLPSDVQAEEEFGYSIFNEPAWRAIGRVILLVRTILLYTVIAPGPYVFVGEVGGTFPRFNFFKVVPGTFSYSSYSGLGNLLVMTWAGLLLVSGILFLYQLIRRHQAGLGLVFVLCVLFNFILHLNYGYEPFLYSPDWAYAVIFFVAVSLAPLAEKWAFQGGLFAFLILLAYNQFHFFQFIFKTIAPFNGQGG